MSTIQASRNAERPGKKGSVRQLLAAGLWYTGCPQAQIAAFLGVSRQRVEQMLDKAGVQRERINDAEIVRRIREAQAAGLVRRADIVTAVKGRTRLNRARISALLTQATGAMRKSIYIPPPGTPAGWRWCVKCQAFAEPSSRLHWCRTHCNALMREQRSAARRAAGVPTRAEAGRRRGDVRIARTRERLASVAHLQNVEAARVLGITPDWLSALRSKYGRDGTKEAA